MADGIGDYYGHDVSFINGGAGQATKKAIAHGVSRAAIAKAQGNKTSSAFWAGFVASGFAAPKDMDPFVGTMATAALSGTTSVITGGKFSNGAMTGAFVHMFNSIGGMLTHINENQRINSMEPDQFRDEMNFSGTDYEVKIAKYSLHKQLRKPFVYDMDNARINAPVGYLRSDATDALNVVQYMDTSSGYKYEYNCSSVSSCNVKVYK